jgi:hypothetical protein
VVWGSVGEQVCVPCGVRVALVALVGRRVREHVAEHLVESTAYPSGNLVHADILHRCHDEFMGLREKAKELADVALQKAGEYSQKAAEKAAELSEVAREKAPGYVDRAADLTVKAVDATASGVDKATGGRFHEKIEGGRREGGGDPRGAPRRAHHPSPRHDFRGRRPEEAITLAATNPEATDPDTPKPDRPTPARAPD